MNPALLRLVLAVGVVLVLAELVLAPMCSWWPADTFDRPQALPWLQGGRPNFTL